MKKSLLFTVILGVILAVGTYFLLSNSHVKIFPGIEYEYDYLSDRCIEDSGNIALIDLDRSYSSDCPDAKLTAGGYIVAVIVIGLLPFLVSFILSKIFFKKKK
jgi:putative flippase GtrA